jgi:hypothetical protein
VRYAAIGVVNVVLALAMHVLAPAEPLRSDRDAYDYVARAPFAPDCPFSIYCYRVVVPAIVSRLPFDADTSWRVYQIGANAAAGSIIATAAGSLSSAASLPVFAAIIAHTSYGFAFTAYDPYTADPMVFVIAALLTWCWIRDRLRPAILLGTSGIFAKETVALIAASIALAAYLERRPRWTAWLAPALGAAIALAAFHVISRLWLNWEIASNPAAQLAHGSWLGLWWRNNPFLERKVYMIFATFGFAWVLAAMAVRAAPLAWRTLAAGSVAPLLLLTIAQTPERAIGNAFHVVVPLAAWYASRAPVRGAIAIVLNALITAKAGSSSVWLPSATWILIPAAIATAALAASGRNPETSRP